MEIIRIEKCNIKDPFYVVYYNGGMGSPRLTEEEKKEVAKVFEMIVSKYRQESE